MHSTKNDLPENVRSKMVTLLNQRLASCVDLESQLKQAHWNVKGPQFIALHELFDTVFNAVRGYVDLIAERAAQLGGQVNGTVRMAAGASSLKEYPGDIVAGSDHVDAVSRQLAAFGKEVRAAIDTADKAEDKDTADLFTEVSRGIDQWLWFVESHAQAEA